MGRKSERLRRVDHRDGGYLFLGGRSMLKSKFFNYFFIVMFLGSLAVVTGCSDDDDDDDEKARLQLQIATEEEKAASLAKTVAGDKLVASERAATAAKLAANKAAQDLLEAEAALQTALRNAADAEEVRRLKAEVAAAKRLFDETTRIENEARIVFERARLDAQNAARDLAEEVANSKLEAEKAAADKIALLERVHIDTHDPDHDPELHAVVDAAQRSLDVALSDQRVAEGIVTDRLNDQTAAVKAVTDAQNAVNDAVDADKPALQLVLNEAEADKVDADKAVLDAQTAKTTADGVVTARRATLTSAFADLN